MISLGKLLGHILVLLTPLGALTGNATELHVELSKPKFFVGESVQVQFVLYSDLPVLDIEVARFPEFSGFWKENVLLRQGPVSTLPAIGGKRRVVIGAYRIVAVAEARSRRISGMKVIVRDPEERELTQRAAQFDVISLPRLPSPFTSRFTGAVGDFRVRFEQLRYAARPGDTLAIRLWVEGDGNLEELAEPNLNFPTSIRRLSFRTMPLARAEGKAQLLEWTVQVSSNGAIWTPPPWVFFDPAQQRYREVVLPDLSVELLPPSMAPDEAKPIPSLERTPGTGVFLLEKPAWWIAQFCLVIVWLVFRARQRRFKQRLGVDSIPAEGFRISLKECLSALHSNRDEGLRLAREFLMERIYRSEILTEISAEILAESSAERLPSSAPWVVQAKATLHLLNSARYAPDPPVLSTADIEKTLRAVESA